MFENCFCLFYTAEAMFEGKPSPKNVFLPSKKLDAGYVCLHERREALHKANSYNKVPVTSGNRLELNDRSALPIKGNDIEDVLSDEISWGTNFIPANAKHGTV